MLTNQLLRLVADQPEIRETRTVEVWGPQLRAAVDSGQIRRLDLIAGHPDQTTAIKTFRYGHLVGPAQTQVDIAHWQEQFPAHQLPGDLAEFLLHVDGVHFWADLDQARAYFGVAPLVEWEDAATVLWSGLFEHKPCGSLVISYHQNGDYYVVLDTATSVYRWYDLQDFDRPVVIGSTVADLITWLWTRAAELRPSTHEAGKQAVEADGRASS